MRSHRRMLAFFLLSVLAGCRQPAPPVPETERRGAAGRTPLASVAPADEALEPAPVTAIVGGTVITCTGADPIEDATVLVERDRIVEVGPREQVDVPAGARVVDAKGKWVTPGLVDSHIHFFQSGGLYTRPDVIDLTSIRPYASEVRAVADSTDETFRRWLVSGVTAVVDVGGPMSNFALREKARTRALAPRVAVAGPLISTVSREKLDIGDPPIVRATTPEEARALVRKQLEHEPDLVKIWFIVTDDLPREKTLDIVRAAIDEAHFASVRVAVHATELESARAAVEAGADVLVHDVDDAPVDQAFVDLLAQKGTILTPTLVVLEGYAEVLSREVHTSGMEEKYGDPAVMSTWAEISAAGALADPETIAARKLRYETRRDVMAKNLLTLARARIPIAAGTDAGNIGTLHGPSLHRELRLMSDAGLTPAEVLVSATRDAARVFAAEPGFGTIEPGKLADLLILDADPLLDVGNLARIHRIVKGGIVLTQGDVIGANPQWVVAEQVEAYNARDVEAFLSYYTDDAVIERIETGEIVSTGKDAMRVDYGKFFEANPDVHVRILQRTVTGSMVVDRELVTGIGSRPYLRAVAVYRVTGGLIDHVWFLPREP